MERKLIVALCAILFFHHSCFHYAYAQTTLEESKLSVIIRGGLLHTDLYNPTFYWLTCFEGCWAEEQNGITGKSVNIGVAYQINPKNQLAILTGYSEFGYHERGFASPGSGVFSYERDVIWKFWGIELEHRSTLYRIGRASLFLGNGLRFETPFANDKEINKDEVLKNIGISYNGRLGVAYSLSPRLSILGNGIFKTSLLKYNRVAPVAEHNDYQPYGIGGEIGIKINI